MSRNVHATLDAAISDVDRLRTTLRKNKTDKVRSAEEKRLVASVCSTWFNNYRQIIESCIGADALDSIDGCFRSLHSATDRETRRSSYESNLKAVRAALMALRPEVDKPHTSAATDTSDAPPDFSKLVPDPKMQAILSRRWNECVKCVANSAPLAAVVMMGGLAEALLLTKVHREPEPKTRVFSAKATPKDNKTGKALNLKEWTLRDYIEVAHELKWITVSTRDVGVVVRDYRNYIHPFKELTHGVELADGDAKLFWEISKEITRQLLA